MTKIHVAMIGGGIGGFMVRFTGWRCDLMTDTNSLPERFLQMQTVQPKVQKNSGIRGYATWQELLEKENGKAECIVIVTPNDSHFEISTAALQAGYNVVLDKPMTRTLDEARALVDCVESSNGIFAMTYTYTGYPMVRQMRERILTGEIGTVRTVSVEYRQGWLADPIENDGQKQASWRTDPKKSGSGALGDIGSHAEQLARFTTGLAIQQVRGDVHTVVKGRQVEDHAECAIENGTRCYWRPRLLTSYALVNETMFLSECGEIQGSLSWNHNECDALKFTVPDGTETISFCVTNRAPSGHPAGFIEAFANIYKDCADRMQGQELAIMESKMVSQV